MVMVLFTLAERVEARSLDRARNAIKGLIDLAPPQIMSLAHLARFASAQAVLADAAQRTPPCICPENYADQGEIALCYPGDPLHSVSERALPGPTRLLVRQRRFVPEHGLESLWA